MNSRLETPTSSTKSKLTIYQMATISLMTALLCILGPMSIPIGAIPISFTNFVIYLTVYLLGTKPRYSRASSLLRLLRRPCKISRPNRRLFNRLYLYVHYLWHIYKARKRENTPLYPRHGNRHGCCIPFWDNLVYDRIRQYAYVRINRLRIPVPNRGCRQNPACFQHWATHPQCTAKSTFT